MEHNRRKRPSNMTPCVVMYFLLPSLPSSCDIYTERLAKDDGPGLSFTLRLQGAQPPQRIRSEGHTGRLIQTRSPAGGFITKSVLAPNFQLVTNGKLAEARTGTQWSRPRCPKSRTWSVPSTGDKHICNVVLTYQKVGIDLASDDGGYTGQKILAPPRTIPFRRSLAN